MPRSKATERMASDRADWRPNVVSYWRGLEQDWQSVAVGALVVVVTILLGIQIPW
ncbi:hypothetical protein ACLI4Y_06015 [Natrialbaceae archaeon A-CW3]